MSANILGIDLGTENIKVYSTRRNAVIVEKNAIAIQNRKKVAAIGSDAYEMYEKAPDSFQIRFPIRHGVIADYQDMCDIFMYVLQKYFKSVCRGATAVIAVPTGLSEVQTRAYHEMVESTKIRFRNILMCEKPIAAAVGMDVPLMEPSAICVVDAGADTVEIALLSAGSVVISRQIPIGSNQIADSLVSVIRRSSNLLIGHKTALTLLERAATATDPRPDRLVTVIGRDLLSGYPGEIAVSEKQIYDAALPYYRQISENLKILLDRAPTELLTDVRKDGIWLTGGLAGVRGLPQYLANESQYRVNVSRNPIKGTAIGLSRIGEDKELSRLTYSMRRGHGVFRNSQKRQ